MLAGVSLFAQRDSGERATWNEPVKPFRVIGNVYYIGVSGVTSFLITTPQGHILLDGGFPETAPRVEKNIAALGFHIQDVKVLLNSHAHYDHCGGLAELKRLSRAQMVASRSDAEVLESGGRVSFEGWKNSGFPPVKVDRVISDGETVQLGDVTLTAVLTPGHTTVPGYQLVNNLKYPQIVSDYERSFAKLRQLPCDVFLAPHGSFFHLDEKRARMGNGGANPFIDSSEFRTFIEQSERDFDRELKKQQSNIQK
jgi:metallo-beta-lactamase class B